jgi:hypothetical protein
VSGEWGWVARPESSKGVRSLQDPHPLRNAPGRPTQPTPHLFTTHHSPLTTHSYSFSQGTTHK